MSTTTVARQHTRCNFESGQVDPSHLEHIIQANRTKDIKDRRAKQKSKTLGEVAWEQMFNSNNPKLPNTNFMCRLKQAITLEQFQQINDDMLRGMNIVKEGFCNRDHHTLQEAKSNHMSF